MKILTGILILLISALPALALKPGDKVTPDALAKADFIKGQPIKAWEEGKPYLILCWATSSSPTISTLPLLEDYHKKYHEKGLRVIAVNVGENDREKVAKFVKLRGDSIPHSVAFVPSGDTFQVEWLEAAGIKNIPHAFVVKDGTLILHDHPARVSSELIEALIAGGEKQQQWFDQQERQKISKEVVTGFLRDYSTAQIANDPEAMEAAMASIAEVQPDFVHLSRMKVDVAIVRKDWPAAKKDLDAIENPQAALMTAAILSRRYDTSADQPPMSLFESVARILAENGQEDPSVKASLARVQWKLGKKEEALASARLAALNPAPLPKAPLEAFAKSFEEGKPQTLEELIAAVSAASQKQ